MSVLCLNSDMVEFDPQVSIESLAGGDVEKFGGIGHIVYDENFFHFVPEMLARSTACHPQFNIILISLTEALQDHPLDLRRKSEHESVGVVLCSWTMLYDS